MIILNRRPFAELFREPADLKRVTAAITRAIGESFTEKYDGQMRAPTQDEIKRRFAICEKWFRDLRGERKWSIDRVLAALPQALRAELTGTNYEPDNRTLWVPGDGAR